MKGSWKVCTIAGIGVQVHWTFLLLLAWIVFAVVSRGGNAMAAAQAVVFVAAVFVCIVLHELGHALTARRFGIQTRDITLLPIGGLARLERMPDDPLQELLVALGGPAVTLVLAAVFGVAAWLVSGADSLLSFDMLSGSFLARLAWVNGLLLAFNLLPAFPMDGGRALRAALHFTMDDVQATTIASSVGQGLAILMGLAAVFLFQFNLILLIIAVFVYFGAREEMRTARVRGLCRGVPVRHAMITHYRTLGPRDTLATAADELLAGAQQDFPVVENGSVLGMLVRSDLVHAMSEYGREAAVGDVMRSGCPTVEDSASLESTLLQMQGNGCPTLPVTRRGELVGIITLENVGEWMMLQSSQHRPRPRSEAGDLWSRREPPPGP